MLSVGKYMVGASGHVKYVKRISAHTVSSVYAEPSRSQSSWMGTRIVFALMRARDVRVLVVIL